MTVCDYVMVNFINHSKFISDDRIVNKSVNMLLLVLYKISKTYMSESTDTIVHSLECGECTLLCWSD